MARRTRTRRLSYDALGTRQDVDELGHRYRPAEERRRQELHAGVAHQEALRQ